VQLVPGYIWRLETAGTNAIGIATQHRQPAMVDGPEHFMQPLKTLTTVSAPISDERTGQLRGTFSLVCRAEAANPLLLPVARHGAREIGEAMVDHSSAHERMLTEAFLRARRRERGPLVLVGDGLMVRNAAGARLFSEAQGASMWKTAVRAMETSDRAPVQFVSRRGGPVLGRVEPILADDVLVGALIRCAGSRGPGPQHQRRMFGWDSLTETELALAELVASGLTNREVAARLFLSHHTVDTHLRHIFRKLDINSRVELARLFTTTTTTSTSHGEDRLAR
jgi:DNA-binding CsgD family transcriptional regulator